MFDDMEGKIKALAKVICFIGIILLLTIFVVFALGFNIERFFALFVIIIGGLAAWIGFFFIYGFGWLKEKKAEIEEDVKDSEPSSEREDGMSESEAMTDEQGLSATDGWRDEEKQL